jgi:hypothetical protein
MTVGCAQCLGCPAHVVAEAVAQRLEAVMNQTLGALTQAAAQR